MCSLLMIPARRPANQLNPALFKSPSVLLAGSYFENKDVIVKKLLLTLSLLLTLGLSASGVAAQVEAPNLDDVDPTADVEGIQSIYDRTFSVDFEALMASPEADFDNLDISAMMSVISIQGMTFDSEDNANAYLDQMRDELDASMEEDPSTFDGIEISDLDGFDVDGLQLIMDMADLEITASVVIFVDGNQVFQIMVMNSDLETAKASADAVTQFVIDAETETEEVTFNADGTSTGGVFDRMPTGDDEVVGDLTGVLDSEIFVEGAE